MEVVFLLLGLVIGAVAASAAMLAIWKPKVGALEAQVSDARVQFQSGKNDVQQMREAFKSLASDALKLNSESFLTLAKENLGRHQQEAETELDKKRESID